MSDLTSDLAASLPGHADAVQDLTRAAIAQKLVETAADLMLQASRLLAVTPGAAHTCAALTEALQQARIAHERTKPLLRALARRT